MRTGSFRYSGGKLGNCFWHGGRKQHGLAALRNHLGNLAQVVDEAKIQHLVGFVENEIAHGASG